MCSGATEVTCTLAGLEPAQKGPDAASLPPPDTSVTTPLVNRSCQVLVALEGPRVCF